MPIHKITNQDGSEPIDMDVWLQSLPEPQKTEFLRITKAHHTKLNEGKGEEASEWGVVWDNYIRSNDLIHTIE
jgi:hypothetical protein